MAKGIAMNGQLRGKLGGVVYSRVNGEQISRVRVEKVTNPKTTAQQAQRAIFATVTAAYSKMKAICDHSFEGLKYGSKTQQAFMKENLAIMRNRAAADEGNFIIPNISVLMANPYLISKGSLTSVKNVNMGDLDAGIIFGEGLFTSTITVKDFCLNLGINKGDQITIVAIVDAGTGDIAEYAGRGYRNWQFRYCRLTVNANAADSDLVLSADTFGNAIIAENIAGDATSDSEDFNAVYQEASSSLLISALNMDTVLAMAVIRSAKDGDKWLRSTEHLTLGEGLSFNFNDILPAWQAGVTPLYVGSERYLNNAEQESITQSASIESVPVRTIVAATQAESVNNLAVIRTPGSLLFDGAVIVENLTSYIPYQLQGDGTLTKLVTERPYNQSAVITLENAAKLLGYTPTVNQN